MCSGWIYNRPAPTVFLKISCEKLVGVKVSFWENAVCFGVYVVYIDFQFSRLLCWGGALDPGRKLIKYSHFGLIFNQNNHKNTYKPHSFTGFKPFRYAIELKTIKEFLQFSTNNLKILLIKTNKKTA